MMAAEFYRKSTAIYEEFKRRELHYLSIERSVNINYDYKNEINLPLEDYLENINRREKESEKSYRDLLQHLEEMDQRTDLMSLKLEKLNALRNAAISTNISTWPSMDHAFERTFNKPYYGRDFLQSVPTAIHERPRHMNPVFDNHLPKVNSCSEATQTEHVFCEKCHYPFTRNSSNANTTEELVDPNETIYMEHLTNYPLSMNSNQGIYKAIEQSVETNKMFNKQSISDKSLQNPVTSSRPFENLGLGDNDATETNNVNQGLMQNINSNTNDPLIDNDLSGSLHAGVSLLPKEITMQKEEVIDQTNRNISLNEDASGTLNNFVTKAVEREAFTAIKDSTSEKSQMFEKAASKSDDESINHEFDFLESDRRPSVKNKMTELESQISNTVDDIPENIKPDTKCESDMLENNSVEKSSKAITDIKSPYNEVPVSEVSKNVENTGSFHASNDTKLDSSLSEEAPSPARHLADISDHSESDSFSDKESPFTASAAYQALLGNVAATKAIQKTPSPTDSDSEDEIEHALSSAVRRSSNINFDVLTQVKKKEEKKECIPEVNPKIETKASKPAFTGKPQSKLSKNTRKVLGLDISSGSEMELEVKPTTNKIDEDSDEFDFYN